MCLLNTYSTFWKNFLLIVCSIGYHSMSECVLLMEKDTILVIIDGPHVVHTIKTHHINFY